MYDSLWMHGLQHSRLPCPSPSPRVFSNSRPLSWWCHPTILSFVAPLSSCTQSFPASGSFPMNSFFASDGQSTGASSSASALPVNIHGWFPLGLTGLISVLSKGHSGVLSRATVGKNQLITHFLFIPSSLSRSKNFHEIHFGNCIQSQTIEDSMKSE